MVMDPRFTDFSESVNEFKFDNDTPLPLFNQSTNFENRFGVKDDSLDLNFMDFPSLPTRPELNNIGSNGFEIKVESFSPSLPASPELNNIVSSSFSSETADSLEDHDSDTVLKYLNQILLEESMEEKPSMFHDPLALETAEKSFYEALGENYPPLPHQQPLLYMKQNVDSTNNYSKNSLEYSININSTGANSTDPQWVVDPGESRLLVRQSNPLDNSFQTTSQWSFGSISSNVNDPITSTFITALAPNIFSDSESILQFKRGMEEASKFLPNSNPLIIDLDKYTLPSESKVESDYVVKVEKDDASGGSRVRKHHHSEDSDLDECRSQKQSAVYVDEEELSEMFDRVLLFTDVNGDAGCCNDELPQDASDGALMENVDQHGSNSGKNCVKRTGNQKDMVDLTTLVVSCAQSVAADDYRTAYEQLKQIRQHSSPSGDASQRLAHIFTNGLEARLAGTGSQLYSSLASKKISATEKLKAYQLYHSACPFKKISILFANSMIYCAASEAAVLHIVDFGILYGFQWPILIQHLSTRPGGPPKLRVTGIELPQPGFRPAERVEATGRRLAKYCERFNVPFEYHAIATQKWETIKIEDLKMKTGEVLAVNCLFRFKNLPDEAVVVDCPRDAILKLIRKMNPDIFVQAVVSGSYSAPFFVTRFREALFYYSAMFDMFDNTIPRDNQQRMNFEQEFYGREVMNIIACEGTSRVERPETYRQWNVRNIRAGFKSLALNKELLKKLREKEKAGYHKDFVFDEDGHWILQGWKGRITFASSCWIPA